MLCAERPAVGALSKRSGDSMANGRPLIQPSRHSAAGFQIIEGLCAPQARIAPKYLYDPLGARLFEAITELPEYYPTRTERAILRAHASEIALRMGAGATLIELGAGSCEKAAALLGTLKPAQYVALDISAEFVSDALHRLQARHPDIEMVAVGADLEAGIILPASVSARRRQFLYLGSSIGNFDPLHALELLRRVRACCDEQGGVVIGFDLVKPEPILNAAYDDALGVTGAFNLNVLNHLNALIGSDFHVQDWTHRAAFNTAHSRIEIHLEAKRDVRVVWDGGTRAFTRGERIHTENSYKYGVSQFEALLSDAGFRELKTWTDDQNWFAVCHARA
jgi:dimethylhistidine N-methyltransferase